MTLRGHAGRLRAMKRSLPALILGFALTACADIAATDSPEARQSARAEAIALAFSSERWSSEVG